MMQGQKVRKVTTKHRNMKALVWQEEKDGLYLFFLNEWLPEDVQEEGAAYQYSFSPLDSVVDGWPDGSTSASLIIKSDGRVVYSTEWGYRHEPYAVAWLTNLEIIIDGVTVHESESIKPIPPEDRLW
jgi:hypothetical protein